ncbi:MAG: histidine kinase [Lachnospiraceae bacterium]|nr:histidine kinase [Lachnospiraceae bacterium]
MLPKGSSVNRRLNTLVLVSFVPFTLMVVFLLAMVNRFSQRYDVSVENITKANAYNITFKENVDYTMYIIVVNSERADELVDTNQPHELIDSARTVFQTLEDDSEDDYAKNQLKGIVKSLNSLEKQVNEVEADAQVSGSYDRNLERLDLDIRVLTELIQEQIQQYIYYEAGNLETIREGIRSDVERMIQATAIIFAGVLLALLLASRKITSSITHPIQKLCDATKQAGGGDFAVRTKEWGTSLSARDNTADELQILNDSFNQMMEKIGNLVEDIKIEQLNLRATELKLLQAQINPHFLYNTLDAIIWLAEAGKKEQVITMVSALSDFFRTGLSKGRDFITIQEEETNIHSYLKIQQFRYRDILEYEIRIPEELYPYQILKLTLQPLVENALYHGIKNKRGTGKIRVTGEKAGERLILTVEDTGIGMTRERLEYARKVLASEIASREKSGFGLYNIEQRIQLNYGPEYGMRIDSTYGKGTKVTVTIPAVPNVNN